MFADRLAALRTPRKRTPRRIGVEALEARELLAGTVAPPPGPAPTPSPTPVVDTPPPAPGTIRGVVYADANGDGVRGATEAGIRVQRVELLNTAGTAVATAWTAEDGSHAFSGVRPETYRVRFELDAAAFDGFSAKWQGTDRTRDSDVNPASGVTDAVTLTSGGLIANLDAGELPHGTFAVAADDAFAGAEDASIAGNVLLNDGGARLAGLVSGPAHGALTLNPDGTFLYAPPSNFYGSDRFTYSARNGAGTTSVAAVTLTVTAVNDAPVAAPDQYVTAVGSGLDLAVLANDSDPDGDAISVYSFSAPSHGTVAPTADGLGLRYTPAAGYLGQDAFTYTLTDTFGAMSATTVTLSAIGGQWASGVRSVSTEWEGEPYEWRAVRATGLPDADGYGDPVAAWSPAEMNGSLQTLDLSFRDPAAARGFVIREAAGHGFVRLVEFRDVGGAYHVAWASSDQDHDDTPAEVADFTRVLPADTGYLVDGIRITIDTDHDPEGWEEIDAVRLLSSGWVESAGSSLVAADDAVTLSEDGWAAFDVRENDGPRVPAYLSITTGPTHGYAGVSDNGTPLDLTDDRIEYYPDADYTGTDAFVYAVADLSGNVATATATVNVTPANDAPLAEDTDVVAVDGSAVRVDARDYADDLDGDTLTLGVGSNPAHGTVTLSDNGTPTEPTDDHLLYTPAAGFTGVDRFTYTVDDGHGGTATGVVLAHVYGAGQWASSVVSASSWDATEVNDGWSPGQALGQPDAFGVGDWPTAWFPAEADAGVQTIVLGFGTPGTATGVVVREASGTGTVRAVTLIDTQGEEHLVWAGADAGRAEEASDLVFRFPETAYDVAAVKLVLDTDDSVDEWDGIDAVRLLSGGAPASLTVNRLTDTATSSVATQAAYDEALWTGWEESWWALLGNGETDIGTPTTPGEDRPDTAAGEEGAENAVFTSADVPAADGETAAASGEAVAKGSGGTGLVAFGEASARDYLAYLQGPDASPDNAPGGKYGAINAISLTPSPRIKGLSVVPIGESRWLFRYDDWAEVQKALDSGNLEAWDADALRAMKSTSPKEVYYVKNMEGGNFRRPGDDTFYSFRKASTTLSPLEKLEINRLSGREVYTLSAEEKASGRRMDLLKQAYAFYANPALKEGDIAGQMRLLADLREAWGVGGWGSVKPEDLKTDADAARYVFHDGKLVERETLAETVKAPVRVVVAAPEDRLNLLRPNRAGLERLLGTSPKPGIIRAERPERPSRLLMDEVDNEAAFAPDAVSPEYLILRAKDETPELGAFLAVDGRTFEDVWKGIRRDIDGVVKQEQMNAEGQAFMWDVVGRGAGLLQAAGGVLEMTGAAGAAAAPDVTVTKVGAWMLLLHGADNVAAGLLTATRGVHQPTATYTLVRDGLGQVGVNENVAGWAAFGTDVSPIGVAAGGKASLRTLAQAGQISLAAANATGRMVMAELGAAGRVGAAGVAAGYQALRGIAARGLAATERALGAVRLWRVVKSVPLVDAPRATLYSYGIAMEHRVSELRRLMRQASTEVAQLAGAELALLKRGLLDPTFPSQVVIDDISVMNALRQQKTPLASRTADLIEHDVVKTHYYVDEYSGAGLYKMVGSQPTLFAKMKGRTPFDVVDTMAHEMRHYIDELVEGVGYTYTQRLSGKAAFHNL